MQESERFKQLGPNEILTILEEVGLEPDGRITALNSYENRVYRIGIHDQSPVVVKFYRPGRWSDETILEEHQFTEELAAEEIPVIAPLSSDEGKTLYHQGLFRFSIYPCVGGRPPELDNPQHLEIMGRYMARIHNLGEKEAFKYRPHINIETFAVDSSRYLLEQHFIPMELEYTYKTIIDDLLKRLANAFERAGEFEIIRLHGDAHAGNILWSDDKPLIMDFDDARMGPAIQDLWMFLSGDREYMSARLEDFLKGYSQFRSFNPCELHLLEAFRTLRIMHYAAWLAMRWDDPAFPRAFPYFNGQRYWEDHILSLREQSALLEEPPLQWLP